MRFAKNPVVAVDLPGGIDHEQDLPPLESQADAADASLTGGRATGEPPGVLPARYGR